MVSLVVSEWGLGVVPSACDTTVVVMYFIAMWGGAGAVVCDREPLLTATAAAACNWIAGKLRDGAAAREPPAAAAGGPLTDEQLISLYLAMERTEYVAALPPLSSVERGGDRYGPAWLRLGLAEPPRAQSEAAVRP